MRVSKGTGLRTKVKVWLGSDRVPFQYLGMTRAKWDLLEELSMHSEYWSKAFGFVQSIVNVKLSSLGKAQRNWLTEIILSLDNELYKRSWRL